MIKLHVILCAVAVFGMGANATIAKDLGTGDTDDPDPKKLILMADVGSGGTRLVVMVKTADGKVVQCCEKVCAKESGDIHSRFSKETKIENVTHFAGQLVVETFKNIKNEACMPYAKNIDAFKVHLKQANIALFATAGARRLEVKDPGIFKRVFLGGFEKYFASITKGPDAKVTGAVLPGNYEAYFGITSAADRIKEVNLDLRNVVYLEVGGASQQVAWFENDMKHHGTFSGKVSGKQFAPRFKASTADKKVVGHKGVVNIRYPNEVEGIQNSVVKQAYAASVLGDGGDRLVVHLVKHAISKATGATATVPCLPKGFELEGNGVTITVGDTPRKEGDDLPPAITDLRNDAKVLTFLKVDGNKIVADPDQDGSKCHTFMKEMFKEEQDEVGGKTKTFASLFKMHQTKYCGDHASMCTDNVEGVPEVDATKMTSFRAVNSPTANTPTVVFNSMALDGNLGSHSTRPAFKVLGGGKTTFSFKALKTVMKKVCDKATNVVTKKAGLDKYGLPGPCAVATEVVLLIEGIFGEDGAKMIENVLPVKSSWTKTAANYVFDMEENEQAMVSGKHLSEKTWSAMAFDGNNTHAMEDAKLADREKTRVRWKKVRAAAIFGAGNNVGGPEGENKKEAVAPMKRRLRSAGHRADGSPEV